jgi:hypothetical protein
MSPTKQVFSVWNWSDDYHFKQSKMLHATIRKLRTHKPFRHAALHKTKKVVEEKSTTTGKDSNGGT